MVFVAKYVRARYRVFLHGAGGPHAQCRPHEGGPTPVYSRARQNAPLSGAGKPWRVDCAAEGERSAPAPGRLRR